MTANILLKVMQARRWGSTAFKTLEEKSSQPRIPHPEKVCFKNKDEIKTVSRHLKLEELTSRAAL